MNQNDFYARLDEYMQSEATFDRIPPLVAQARADGLSILVAFRKNEKGESVAAYGMLRGKLFLLCAPRWEARHYEDYTLAETDISSLFNDLRADGYGGVAFQGNGTVYGVEWSDLFNRPKPGSNEPCPCGSGKKYKKCCGR